MEMRKAYAAALEKIMREDPRVVTVDADVGKALGTEKFRDIFGARATYVGIAEQNMVGVAAGLASYGFKPVCQSFAPFVTRNVCDQICMNLRFTGLKALIVGADPGISAELNGASHMATEDISVMRAIPGMQVFEPADDIELTRALPCIINSEDTVYMRMYRKTLPRVHGEDYKFQFGRIDVLAEGGDVALFTSGIFAADAMKARGILAEKGISSAVVNIHTVKPIDTEGIRRVLSRVKLGVVYENHNECGGLYSAVAEVNSASPRPRPVYPFGIRDRFGVRGTLEGIKAELGLTPADLSAFISGLLDDLVE